MWDVEAASGDDGSATGCATHRPPVPLVGKVGTVERTMVGRERTF